MNNSIRFCGNCQREKINRNPHRYLLCSSKFKIWKCETKKRNITALIFQTGNLKTIKNNQLSQSPTEIRPDWETTPALLHSRQVSSTQVEDSYPSENAFKPDTNFHYPQWIRRKTILYSKCWNPLAFSLP